MREFRTLQGFGTFLRRVRNPDFHKLPQHPFYQPQFVGIFLKVIVVNSMMVNPVHTNLPRRMDNFTFVGDEANMGNYPIFIIKKYQITFLGFRKKIQGFALLRLV